MPMRRAEPPTGTSPLGNVDATPGPGHTFDRYEAMHEAIQR